MIYKVSGKAHLWTWEKFKERIEANVVEYEYELGVIRSITYRSNKLITEDILKEFDFTAERLL